MSTGGSVSRGVLDLAEGLSLDWPDLGRGPDRHAVSFVWPAFQTQFSSPPGYFVNSPSSF